MKDWSGTVPAIRTGSRLSDARQDVDHTAAAGRDVGLLDDGLADHDALHALLHRHGAAHGLDRHVLHVLLHHLAREDVTLEDIGGEVGRGDARVLAGLVVWSKHRDIAGQRSGEPGGVAGCNEHIEGARGIVAHLDGLRAHARQALEDITARARLGAPRLALPGPGGAQQRHRSSERHAGPGVAVLAGGSRSRRATLLRHLRGALGDRAGAGAAEGGEGRGGAVGGGGEHDDGGGLGGHGCDGE
mmetsp:Transcript_114971/g.159525  ORF Transcript_114971/g.159525 Transcript_114971/m.159525 type:complete len:244 (-) Transcript_114971:37-768(-)